ncbi:MAG: hypothetical protein PVI01_01890 [Gemmatimonadales bacterium]
MGGLLVVVGVVMLLLFTFVVNLQGGTAFLAIFILGVVPTVTGFAVLRASRKRAKPQHDKLNAIKDQLIWRAVAQGGRITAAEAALQAGVPQLEVEFALMALVSDGRAMAEPGEAGEIVYRIDSPL